MIIELLKFIVNQELQAKFIKIDEQVWTNMLKNCDGFINKEVWINSAQPEEIICIIRWESRQQWKAISPGKLKATEEKFSQQMDKDSYQLIVSLEYNLVSNGEL